MNLRKGIKVAIILVILMIPMLLFFWYYRFIPVKYIGYVVENHEFSSPGFYANLNVQTTKENLENAILEGAVCETENIEGKLKKMQNNQRIVMSWGKPIRFFYYFGDESNPIVYVKYKGEKIDNKVYYYTISYYGPIIDYVNY